MAEHRHFKHDTPTSISGRDSRGEESATVQNCSSDQSSAAVVARQSGSLIPLRSDALLSTSQKLGGRYAGVCPSTALTPPRLVPLYPSATRTTGAYKPLLRVSASHRDDSRAVSAPAPLTTAAAAASHLCLARSPQSRVGKDIDSKRLALASPGAVVLSPSQYLLTKSPHHCYRKLPRSYRTPSPATSLQSRTASDEKLIDSKSLSAREDLFVERTMGGKTEERGERVAGLSMRKNDEVLTEDQARECQPGLLDNVLRRVKSRGNNPHDFRSSHMSQSRSPPHIHAHNLSNSRSVYPSSSFLQQGIPPQLSGSSTSSSSNRSKEHLYSSRGRATTLDGGAHWPASNPSDLQTTYTGSSVSVQSEGWTFEDERRVYATYSGGKLLKSGWDDEEEATVAGTVARRWDSACRFKTSKKQDNFESLSSSLTRFPAAESYHLPAERMNKLSFGRHVRTQLSPHLKNDFGHPPLPAPAQSESGAGMPPRRPARSDASLVYILRSPSDLAAEHSQQSPLPLLMGSQLSPRPCRHRPTVTKSDEIDATADSAAFTTVGGVEKRPPLPKRSRHRTEPLALHSSNSHRSPARDETVGSSLLGRESTAARKPASRSSPFRDWSDAAKVSDGKSIDSPSCKRTTPSYTPLLHVLVDKADCARNGRSETSMVAGLSSPIQLDSESHHRETSCGESADKTLADETVKSDRIGINSVCTTPASTAGLSNTASFSPSSSLGNPLTPLDYSFDRHQRSDWSQEVRRGKGTFGASFRGDGDNASNCLRSRTSVASAGDEGGRQELERLPSRCDAGDVAMQGKGSSLCPMTIKNKGVHVETDPVASVMRIALKLEVEVGQQEEFEDPAHPFYSKLVSLSNADVEAIGFAWLRMREARNCSMSTFAAALDCQSIAQGQPQEIQVSFDSGQSFTQEEGSPIDSRIEEGLAVSYGLFSPHLNFPDFNNCSSRLCSSTSSTASSSGTFQARPLMLTSRISCSKGSRSLDSLRQSGIRHFHKPLLRPCSSGNPGVVYGRRGVSFAYRSPLLPYSPN